MKMRASSTAMNRSQDLWRQSATTLAALIKSGDVSSREVVDAHLGRIEAVNPMLNAVTVMLRTSAREAADAADVRRKKKGKRDLPPLHGVPITVKENIDCVGTPTTFGLAVNANALPEQDAPVIERMRAAGAILIGRTNMPEMGLRVSTSNPFRGLTRNPWNAQLTAGGSSGGEGSAVASGMSPLGIGNDIGGSLRNPAFCCGVAALKPTQGRVPYGGAGDGFLSAQVMLTDGPIARSVADLRLVLELVHRQHVRDPRSVTVALEGPRMARRVAMVTSLPGSVLDPAIVASVRAAGSALASAGYQVEEAIPPEIELINHLWTQFQMYDLSLTAESIRPLLSAEVAVLMDALIAKVDPSVTHAKLHQERSRLGRAWSTFFAQYPIVLGPVWPSAPFAHDADVASPAGSQLMLDMQWFVTPGNLLGIPATIVPTRPIDDAPMTVQLYADRFRDDLVLEAAEIIETVFGPSTPVDPFVV
ncbi:amidase [Halomonas sp. LR5S13]|uniref:amidase n=1 Tax=Halomonas rhizosphaerae TaxID=3043296 RepID=UPI0024A93281|nr:amidase [Halomonas rhizosphaerae]MDI5919640.1 amidase [Halomonas rhizosphaerae]